jgi:phenylalanyl-tRNA synthetase beta chain
LKIVSSWLKDYVKTDLTPVELAERLTMAGFEVESVDLLGVGLTGVYTGRITQIAPHPNADRLVITQVDCGDAVHTIVTAAKNISVGDVVPISLPGAVLANGLRIQKSKLRGVESHGMLCSPVELGMATESDGIWILPPDTALGLDVVAWLGLPDAVLDISVLPNRGDCMGYIGIAREVAALTGARLLHPSSAMNRVADQKPLAIHIETPLCTAYLGRRISGVTVTAAPLWMQRRLTLSGIRPINGIVDVTNYVMLETGQPLHAFNAARLGDEISVVTLPESENVTLLDGKSHAIPAGAIAIRSGDQVCAVAGVIGGDDSSVTASTADLVLESAAFDSATVRRTGRKLGIRTESTTRFERHIDPAMVAFASDRAASLITQLAGGTTSSTAIGIAPQVPAIQVPLDTAHINRLLGTSYTRDNIVGVLDRLGFGCQGNTATVPTWRSRDVTHSADLAEEIARTLGLASIPVCLPDAGPVLAPESNLIRLRKKAACHLVSTGFSEIKTYPLVPKTAETSAHLNLANPLSDALGTLRTSLLPGLLDMAAYNIKRQVGEMRLFEVGKVFSATPDGAEAWHVAGLILGRWYPDVYTTEWNSPVTFSGLQSVVHSLLAQCADVPGWDASPATNVLLHPGQSAILHINGDTIAEYGMVHPRHAQSADLPPETGLFTINLSALSGLPRQTPRFQSFSKFPSVRRDIALTVPRTLSYADVLCVLKTHQSASVTHIRLFDRFVSDKLGPDHCSLAFALTYQALDRTLTDDEVSTAHQTLIDAVCQALPVTIRA